MAITTVNHKKINHITAERGGRGTIGRRCRERPVLRQPRAQETALRYAEQTDGNARRPLYYYLPPRPRDRHTQTSGGATDTPGCLAVSDASAEQSTLPRRRDSRVSGGGKALLIITTHSADKRPRGGKVDLLRCN